jgi:hypothetical protein
VRQHGNALIQKDFFEYGQKSVGICQHNRPSPLPKIQFIRLYSLKNSDLARLLRHAMRIQLPSLKK